MTIDDLKQYLLINSSQFLIGADDLEIQDDELKKIVDRSLAIYGGYKPLKVIKNIDIPDYHYKLSKIDDRYVSGIIGIYFTDPVKFPGSKIPFEWSWNPGSKVLDIQITGSYYLSVHLVPTLEDISQDDMEFLEIVLGLFLISVGSSRKLFTLNDLPFETSADEIIQQGQTIFEEAKQRLTEENNFWFEAIV